MDILFLNTFKRFHWSKTIRRCFFWLKCLLLYRQKYPLFHRSELKAWWNQKSIHLACHNRISPFIQPTLRMHKRMIASISQILILHFRLFLSMEHRIILLIILSHYSSIDGWCFQWPQVLSHSIQFVPSIYESCCLALVCMNIS